MAETLLLTQGDVVALLDAGELVPRLRAAFVAYAARTVSAQRHVVPLPASAPAGANGMVIGPGLIDGIPAFTVKVNTKYPGQTPAIRGVVLLNDLGSGAPLAVLDAGYLTALRTGAAMALSAQALARPDAGNLALIGAGVQGAMGLRALGLVRTLKRVRVFDSVAGKAQAFCREHRAATGCPVDPAGSVAEAVAGADLVLTATWSTRPFLGADALAPGAHAMTLGADQPGKAELTADAIRRGLFVCDDRALAVEMGAVGGVGLDASAIYAELGEVLTHAKPGRTDPAQVTIFASVGLACQDLAAAWLVYEKARKRGVGQRIEFSA
ncbi:MAG: ornithine cyclodeaminase family protein [SAR324 cluster bacterium]